MEMKINQKNAADLYHGYYEEYFDDEIKRTRLHFFSGKIVGYGEVFNKNGEFIFKYHVYNQELIGYVLYLDGNSQACYKKSRKKFGEEIKWKNS